MQLNRYTAASIHLVVSLSVVALLGFMSVYVWYPDFYFGANGAWFPMTMVIMVDAILGPAMMLILYRPGKPGLKLDITLIFIIQASAFAYGASTLYFQRPALIVHHDSLIVCLNPTQVNNVEVDMSLFNVNANPFPFVHLSTPSPELKRQWHQRLDDMPSGSLRVPHYVFGELFQPVNKQTLPEILHEELDLTRAIELTPASQASWDAFVRKHGDKVHTYAYYTLACSNDEYVAALDRERGYIIDAFRMNTLNAFKKRITQPQSLPDIDWLDF